MPGFVTLNNLFLICAVGGGAVFVIRVAMELLGFGETDFSEFGGDTDQGFQYLSFQNFASFFMMFGLVGLAMRHQSGASPLVSLVAAIAAGAATLFIVARLYMAMRRLQSSGNLGLEAAVGAEAEVYMNIPAEGTGKISVRFEGRLREADAVSARGVLLETGERVRVTAARDNLLVVEKIP